MGSSRDSSEWPQWPLASPGQFCVSGVFVVFLWGLGLGGFDDAVFGFFFSFVVFVLF